MDKYQIIGLISQIVTAASAVPYGWGVFRRVITPNSASWSIWAIVGITLWATTWANPASDRITVMFAAICAINPVAILVLALWRGKFGTIGKIEMVAVASAFVAVTLLIIKWDDPGFLPTGVAILADVCALVPTVRFVWASPGDDRPAAWSCFTFGSAIAIYGTQQWNLESLALPVYMLVGSLFVIVPLVSYRIQKRIPMREWIWRLIVPWGWWNIQPFFLALSLLFHILCGLKFAPKKSMLNPSQSLAVEHLSGPLLILAGAGAGKTHTLTERIARMIEKWVYPDSILAVTFTNKAAKEMRERIGRKLGVDMTVLNPYRSSGVPLVGTFHSIGIFFLRNFIDYIWYEKNFVIYDEDDKLRTIKGIIKSMNLDEKEVNARQVIGAISNAKNQGITAGKYDTIVDNYFKSLVRDIYLQYEKVLTQNNALDFDDILLKTHDLLLIPEVLTKLQNKYKYFLVDEYQDTNDIQYKIVRMLSSAERHLCVVGDDWQGIYGWRGANIKNILSFQKDYPGATVVKLEQNYRSTKTIIAWANAVIKCNTEALDKTLWTDNEEWEKIVLIESQDEKGEAQAISKLIKDSDDDYADWAVLYRTNSQSRLIEEALIRSNIPYKIYGGVKFYERKEIKDILAYLRLIFNPADLVSFRRIVNVPSRKIGEKSEQIFVEHMIGYSAPFTDIITWIDEMGDLTPQARKWFASFGAIYADLTEYLKDHGVKETMEQVIKRIGYEEYLGNEYTEEEAETKKENLKEFANMASRYDGMESREALALFLEEIALITDADRDGEGEREMVSLMTIHLAKGLEFKNVIIAWAEEGLFPHSRTLLEPKEIEEERRLMYVAMTRAKKKLHITRARERYNFGNYSANPASRFLKEIPEDLIVRQETEFKNPFSTGASWGKYQVMDHPVGEIKTPTKRSIVSNDPGSFFLWERVRHAQFGIGTIVSISGPIGEIAFGGGNGIKKMHLGVAPIERV